VHVTILFYFIFYFFFFFLLLCLLWRINVFKIIDRSLLTVTVYRVFMLPSVNVSFFPLISLNCDVS